MMAENRQTLPYIQFFINNPVVGMISFLVAIIALALQLYGVFIGKETRDFTYRCNPVKTSIVRADKFKALEVYFDAKLIETDVTAMQVAVWNKGKIPILKSDVLEDIVLLLSPAVRILDAEVTKQSRDVVGLTLNKDYLSDGRLPLSWKILEHNDGGVIQLIISGSTNTDIEIRGSIIGQVLLNKMNNLKTRPQQGPSIRGLKSFFLVMGITLPILVILNLIITNKRNRDKEKQSGQPVKMGKSEVRFNLTYFIMGIAFLVLLLLLPDSAPPFGF